MEEDYGDNSFRDYKSIAQELNKLKNSNYMEYLSLYAKLARDLSELPFKKQIKSVSLIMGEATENKDLTRKLCFIIRDLYSKKIQGTKSQPKLRALILNEIVEPYLHRNQEIFTPLLDLCLPKKEKEKEKEKEVFTRSINYGELLARDICLNAEFFSLIDSDLAQDVLKGLLRNEQFSGLTLRDRYDLLTEVAVNFQEGEPFISQELGKYAESILSFLSNQRNKEIEGGEESKSITVAGMSVPLRGDSYWSANKKSSKKSPREREIEKATKEYNKNHPHHRMIQQSNRKIVGKPSIFRALICLARKDLEDVQDVCFYDIKNAHINIHQLVIKHPSFFTNHEYSIPGFEYVSFELTSPIDQTIFLYGTTEENQPSAVEFKYPYCVQGYDNGVLEVTDLYDAPKEQRNFSLFKQKHEGSIIALLLDNDDLYSSSMDSTIRAWDLKKKECKKVISVAQPVTSMMVQNGIIGFIIENILLGASIEGEHVFELSIKAKNVTSLAIRDDGLVMGKGDGTITFIKFNDKEFQEPKDMDIKITDPITHVYCYDDIIIARSEKACSTCRVPFTD